MSQWSAKRKRRILIIVGIILLIAIIGIYATLTDKKPTCFDGLQNGAESGVDCGGECTKVCIEEVRNLVVWWERPFKVTNGVYNVVAYFENQNLYSGVQEVTYEFRLYNKENLIISEPVVGTTYIEPNKRSAIFESGITTGDNEAYTVFFRIISVQDWQRVPQEFSYSLFKIGEPTLTNQDTSPKLSATVTNTTIYNFQDIPVIVILYNREDNAIAASRTYIDRLDQGQTEQIFYSWPEAFGDTVARVEIIPRIDPFLDISTLQQ